MGYRRRSMAESAGVSSDDVFAAAAVLALVPLLNTRVQRFRSTSAHHSRMYVVNICSCAPVNRSGGIAAPIMDAMAQIHNGDVETG